MIISQQNQWFSPALGDQHPVEGVFMQRAAGALAATFKGVEEGVRQRRVEVVRNLEFAMQ